jgi:glycosyltransferase involved in cell wall biosynthesis
LGQPAKLDGMRVLIVHNHCIDFAGDDVAVASESSLLSSMGHEVSLWTQRNDELQRLAPRIETALRLTHNSTFAAALSRRIAEFRPDVMHCHGLFPRITTSAYDAAAAAGVPVVQTLHDFRLVCCANAFLHRNGRTCELCVTGSSYWGAWHRCYRDSWIGSLFVTHALDVHRRAGTLQRRVQRFIAPSESSKSRFVAAGLPDSRIVVKPNFIADTGEPPTGPRDGALFVGRLSPEKGLRTLIDAWRRIDHPLRILGSGPLSHFVSMAADSRIIPMGHRPNGEVGPTMQQARFLVMPSEWIEGCPLVIVEAFANALPVIASRLGAMAEMVEDGVTGLLFAPGDPDDLAAKVAWAFAHGQDMAQMGAAARRVYEDRFSAEKNYPQLVRIYEDAAAEH